MQRRLGRNLWVGAGRKRRHPSGRGPLSRDNRDPGKTLDDAVGLDNLPRALTEVLESPWRFDAQDLQSGPQPFEMRIESERRPPVDSDRLEASLTLEEPAVSQRDSPVVLRG